MTAQTATTSIPTIIQRQRAFFQTGETKSVEFRLNQLKRLKQAIIDHQNDVIEALKADLGRPTLEGQLEIATVLNDINPTIKKLKSWVKPRRVHTPIDQFPSSAWIQPEPLGIVLIIAPWNYPFQLIMAPLIGAIAAGNCAIVKSSEHAPQVSRIVAKIIQFVLHPEYIFLVEGGIETSKQLLAEKFDYIFFTGGTAVGKIVAQAAATNLTPVTLELGGKSPCIIDVDADLPIAAKRIVWGKFLNAGQTCIAPDYLLVHQQVKDTLLELIKRQIQSFYGDNPANSPDYGRIVNQRQFERLISLLNNGTVVVGGDSDPNQLYIAPTVLDKISWDDPVMEDEIFGPILPILTYDNLDNAIAQINARPKPLALYIFSRSRAVQTKVLSQTSSGGVCINETVMHFAVPNLPFGGVGNSGIGSYHGKKSFDTFSHYKSVLKKGLWLDLNWRYAPYSLNKIKLIKFISGS